ncbi:zinc-finger double domain-containing protein [Phthorimaea operculella]|nr:zinc-finger double domain-containing protein [Phthorimaea operculella]
MRSMRYFSPGSLNKHLQSVHGGRRPAPKHVCHQCGKAFRGKSVLVNHVRTHTGEKPFECAECGRKFAQRTAMNTHVKLVHLKFRRSAKIKPEILMEPAEPPNPVKIDLFPKQEPALPFDTWRPLQGEVYFTIQP